MTHAILPPAESHVVRGACPHDCPDACALLTTVQDGVAIKVHGNPQHRHTDGVLCTKVSRYTERTYHPVAPAAAAASRVGSQRLGSIRACERGTKRLDDIASAAWAKPLPRVSPTGHPALQLLQAPWDRCRARAWRPAFSTNWAHRCWTAPSVPAAGGEALVQTLGGKVGMKVEFFAESKLIIIWGSNSIASNLHFWRQVQQAAKREGAKHCVHRSAPHRDGRQVP
jgi:anaerobic selenocysteine-containing dehydrogenase